MSNVWIENISDESIVDRLTVEQMGEYLAGNEVVAVQLATEFEVVK